MAEDQDDRHYQDGDIKDDLCDRDIATLIQNHVN